MDLHGEADARALTRCSMACSINRTISTFNLVADMQDKSPYIPVLEDLGHLFEAKI